jgi:hypothetical protein
MRALTNALPTCDHTNTKTPCETYKLKLYGVNPVGNLQKLKLYGVGKPNARDLHARVKVYCANVVDAVRPLVYAPVMLPP